MKKVLILSITLSFLLSCTVKEKQPEPVKVQRFGQMIKVRPGGAQKYIEYHQNPFPGVNEMIKACNIRNYFIYYKDDYLFAYFEYTGDDFEKDMEKMAADSVTQAWWDAVKPLMEPIETRQEGEFWANMKEVYHLD